MKSALMKYSQRELILKMRKLSTKKNHSFERVEEKGLYCKDHSLVYKQHRTSKMLNEFMEIIREKHYFTKHFFFLGSH
jgi:hypothetical protein